MELGLRTFIKYKIMEKHKLTKEDGFQAACRYLTNLCMKGRRITALLRPAKMIEVSGLDDEAWKRIHAYKVPKFWEGGKP